MYAAVGTAVMMPMSVALSMMVPCGIWTEPYWLTNKAMARTPDMMEPSQPKVKNTRARKSAANHSQGSLSHATRCTYIWDGQILPV